MDRPFLRAAYNAEADTYDERFRAVQWPKFETFLGEAGEHLAGLGPVLDVGCGTGLLADYLAERCATQVDLIGVDLSEGMLRAFKARGGLGAQADMGRLPFRAEAFGAVVSVTVFRIIPSDERRILSEMARVLRPGGRLVLSLLAHRDDANLVNTLGAVGFRVDKRLSAGQDVGYLATRR